MSFDFENSDWCTDVFDVVIESSQITDIPRMALLVLLDLTPFQFEDLMDGVLIPDRYILQMLAILSGYNSVIDMAISLHCIEA